MEDDCSEEIKQDSKDEMIFISDKAPLLVGPPPPPGTPPQLLDIKYRTDGSDPSSRSRAKV